jgi:hypothetical protein
MPFIASKEPSVAPEGPLPTIPTVLIAVLIVVKDLVYGLVTNLQVRFRQVNPKAEHLKKNAQAQRPMNAVPA